MPQKQPRAWNGAERFEAIFPTLSTVIPLREKLVSGAVEASGRADVHKQIDASIRDAAVKSGATAAQIDRWIEDFTFMGKRGLLSPVKLTAEHAAKDLQGTWNLMSRLTDGRPTHARGHIYYDMDPKNRRGTHLVTMWTEQNHFDKGGKSDTFLLVSLVDLTFHQDGPYDVVVKSKGKILGNFGDYAEGAEVADEFRLVRRSHDENMVGVPSSYFALGGRQSGGYTDSVFFNHSLVYVGGGPGSIVFANAGLPANGNKGRTVDVVDTYKQMSSDSPLVGGWEPIGDYFERMARPEERAKAVRAVAKSKKAHHLFQDPGKLASLKRYSPLGEVLASMGE